MTTPSTTRQAPTGDQLIDAALSGYQWNLGPDRTINWSISNGQAGESWNDPQGVAASLELALAIFALYANVRFNFVGFYSTPTAASSAGSAINLTMSTTGALFPSNSVWGAAFFPTTAESVPYQGAEGDLFLNISSAANSLSSYEPGSAGWFLLIHEIGHALGLKHPHDDGGQLGRPTLESLGLAELDFDWFSIMSYGDSFNFNLRSWDPATPMILDVLALQYMYGKNLQTNAGDSVYQLARNGLYATIWDASGVDIVSAETSDRGWEIYLPDERPSTLVDTRVGYAFPLDEANLSAPLNLYWLAGDIEHVVGSQFGDDIYGNPFDNAILGLGGADYILGWTGNDAIGGGAGNDTIDGGDGLDLADYVAASSNYAWWQVQDGTWRVQDLRSGSPEGTDHLIAIEVLSFGERNIKIAGATVAEQLGYAFENVMRIATPAGSNLTFLTDLIAAVTGGGKTLAQAYGDIVQRADGTTAVAAMTYQFFIDTVPGKGGFDYLVSPTGPNPNNINSAYFQNFSQENRYINFAVNVGAGGEGRAAFQAEYGSLTLRAATREAYETIFGNTPGEAKLDAILDAAVVSGGVTMTRKDYFAIYGGDGLEGLGTKAAMVGWLLTEAAKADEGFFARSNNAYLTDLADGAQFFIDIIGVYAQPDWAFGG